MFFPIAPQGASDPGILLIIIELLVTIPPILPFYIEETQWKERASAMKRIGFIGFGLRSETMLKAFRALEADICVAAVADPRHAQIAPGMKDDPYFAHTRWYGDEAALLACDDLDGVFIGTRCPLHTPLACRVLKTGMPLVSGKARVHQPQSSTRRCARRAGDRKSAWW